MQIRDWMTTEVITAGLETSMLKVSKLMKENGTHEDCIAQMVRLYGERLYGPGVNNWADVPVDDAGRIRIDDLEMAPGIQKKIEDMWESVQTDNLDALSDLQGYRDDFYALFGFGVPGVDYDADVEI
jgi:enoyl-[acyl-carrier protein] reductase/trans-2-enoyl-CoA reductase (NAD+)